MNNPPLNQRLRAFCEHLSRENYGNDNDRFIPALSLYTELSPADMYTNMVKAQSTLFGGNPEAVRRGMDRMMPDSSDTEKAHILAYQMRETIRSGMENLPNDLVLGRIYKTTLLFEKNGGHIWECLFAAAVYYNTVILPKPVPPYASVRPTFMVALSEPERDLYGHFNPHAAPEDADMEEDDEKSFPAQTHDGPKFIQ